MDLLKFWELIFFCVFNWKSGDCLSIVCEGVLEVDRGPVVPMGSNLRVLCRATDEHCGRRFTVYLNQRAQTPLQVINCTEVRLILTNITAPNFELTCKVSQRGREWVVCGKTLWSGHPPDKPSKFRCLAPRASGHIHCSWEKGKETHIPTNYIVTFENKNKSHSFFQWSNNGSFLHIPRSVLGIEGKSSVSIRARNVLGESVSDVFHLSAEDIEIPSTPNITGIYFKSNSSAIVLWQSLEYSGTLKPRVRLKIRRDDTIFLDEREGFEPRRGELVLEGFQPMTQYEFEVQVCATERPHKCSMWSAAAEITSPGIAPSRKLEVWRVFGDTEEKGTQNVTVLWKPLSTRDYSGTVLRYEVSYEEQGEQKIVSCTPEVTRCIVQPSRAVKTLHVSAVTSMGNSPVADLSIEHSGLPSPQVTYVAPVGENSVLLTWCAYAHHTEPADCHIVQWQSNSVNMRWKRIASGQNSTVIEDLKPGTIFNVSLYTVTPVGVSAPASVQVYSKEEVPLSGPKVSIKAVEENRILIQWEELELDQRRGFITHYNLHISKCSSGQRKHKVTVPGPEHGEMWLDSLDTSLDLHVSASNAVGEGPVGDGVNCWLKPFPEAQSQGLSEGSFGVMTSLAAIIAALIVLNFMYWNWSCVRKRTENICINLGPRWLFEKIPKVENSSVRKLLQEGERSASSSSWPSIYSDPPITSVEDIPAGEQTSYNPALCKQDSSGKSVLRTDQLQEDDSGYKPQTSPFLLEEASKEEDSLILEEMTSVPHGSEFLHQWPWNSNQGTCSPDLSTWSSFISPMCSLRPGRPLAEEHLGTCREDGPHGQTLLPDDLVSGLIRLSVEPTQSMSYFPQEVLRIQNNL